MRHSDAKKNGQQIVKVCIICGKTRLKNGKSFFENV